MTATVAPELTAGSRLEALYHARPSRGLLEEAATMALALPLDRQVAWSRRLRAHGYWHLCPLVRCAQDGERPLVERARAAAAAWELDRDRQGRAILRCLLKGLNEAELASVGQVLSERASKELDRGPFVWSVTSFLNEIDMLMARLVEMARTVDRFVVIEAPNTHRGAPKPLYFQEARHHFSRWSAQIDHCVVQLPDGPSAWEHEPGHVLNEWEKDTPDAWARERFQRNVGRDILTDLGAAPDDLVLLTDLDEIVRADQVNRILSATEKGPVVLAMAHHWYDFQWVDPVPWFHAKAFRFGHVPSAASYSDIRQSPFPVLTDAGWHLSFFGGTETMSEKLASVALHSRQDDRPEFADHRYLGETVLKGTDLKGQPLNRSCAYMPASLTSVLRRCDHVSEGALQ